MLIGLASPVCHKPSAGGGSAYLDGVLASTCCDLDATIAASFTSGQTWANLVASPADGASQTDYDFHLGAGSGSSTDDPTFTGSAGSQSAYFACDGGDFFTIKTMANCPTFLKAHRTDRAGTWVCIAFKGPTTTTSNVWWGNSFNAASMGVIGYTAGGPAAKFDIRHLQSNNSATRATLLYNDVGTETDDQIIIMSWDGTSTTSNFRVWWNSATKSEINVSFQTSTTDSDETWRIGAGSNSGAADAIVENGSRIYHFSCGNAYIDDASAASIIAHLETRHGRDYTP